MPDRLPEDQREAARRAFRAAMEAGDQDAARRIYDAYSEASFEAAADGPSEPKPAEPVPDTARQTIEEAYQRAAQDKPEGFPSMGSWVDRQARAFDARGQHRRARLLRDYLAQQQAGELEATRRTAGEALGEASTSGFHALRIMGGRPAPVTTQDRVDRETAALEAAGRTDTPMAPGAPIPYSGVSPERMVDLLGAIGVDTGDMLEPDVRARFHQHFGERVLNDEAATQASEYLWPERARALADQGLNVFLGNVKDAQSARQEIARAEAEAQAIQQETVADAGGAAAAYGGANAVLRGLSLGTVDLRYLSENAHQVAQDAVATMPGMQDALASAELLASLPTFGVLAKGWGVVLRPVGRFSPALASTAANALTMGTASALQAHGDLGDRAEAALHGIGVAVIASPVSKIVRTVTPFLGDGRAANAFSTAAGFLTAEYVLAGGDLENEDALRTFLTGLALGGAHKTPEGALADERLKQARAVVKDGFERAGAIRVGPDGTAVIDLDNLHRPAPTEAPTEVRGQYQETGTGYLPGEQGGRPRRVGRPRPPAEPTEPPPTIGGVQVEAEPAGGRKPPTNPTTEYGALARRRQRLVRSHEGRQGGARGAKAQHEIDALGTRLYGLWEGMSPEQRRQALRRGRTGLPHERVLEGSAAEVVRASQRPQEPAEAPPAPSATPEPPAQQAPPSAATPPAEPAAPTTAPGYRVKGGQRLPERVQNETRAWIDTLPEGTEIRSAGDLWRVREVEGGRILERKRGEEWVEWDRQGTFEGTAQALRPDTLESVGRGRIGAEEAPPPAEAPPAAEPAGPVRTPVQEARHQPATRARILRAAGQRQRRMAAEREAAYEGEERRKAERAATTDALTGLPNRAAFDAARERVDKDPNLVWVQGDLRGFKGLNDALGQEGGDAALQSAANAWKNAARQAGIGERNVFRHGGDEFAAHGTPEQIKRFREILAETGMEHDGHATSFRTSEGATWEGAAEAMTGTKAADKTNPPSKPRRILRSGKTAPDFTPADLPSTPDPESVEVPQRPAIPAAQRVQGKQTTIPARGEEVPARYEVMELRDLLPSHDPDQSFAWSEGYPRPLQERDYTQAGEQTKVAGQAARFNVREVINTAPRATDGPPTVSPDGTVINGNGRTMTLRLLAKKPGGLSAYRAALVEEAGQYGLDAARVRGMEQPVLVRVVDMDPRSPEAQRFARVGQETATRAVSPVAAAARHLNLMGDALFESMRASPESTVAEVVSDPSKGAGFRKALRDALPDAERPTYLADDGSLTAAGKELAEDLILLRGFAEPGDGPGIARTTRILDSLPNGLRRAMGGSAVQINELRRSGPEGASFADGLLEAADYWANVMGKENPTTWRALVDKGGLLVKPPPMSAAADAWMDWLYSNRSKPKRFRDALGRLLKNEEVTAREERGLFAAEAGQTDPTERLRRALDAPADEGLLVAQMPTNGEVQGMPRSGNVSRSGEWPDSVRQRSGADPIMGDAAPEPMGFEAGGSAAFRDTLPKEPTSGFRGRLTSPMNVIRRLARLANVPIRYRYTHPGNAAEYRVGPRVIRVADADNVFAAAHEVGHAIFPVALDRAPQGVLRTLDRFGRRLYQDGAPPNGYVSEGWAEWVRELLQDPAAARRNAPDVARWWDDFYNGQSKRWRKRWDTAADAFGQYAAQGEANRLRTVIYDPKRDKAPTSWGYWRSAFVKVMAESGIGLREAQQAAGSQRPLAWWERPYSILKGYRLAHSSTAAHWLERGAIGPWGESIGPSMRDALRHVNPEQRKDFSDFLVAHHVLDLIGRGYRTKMSEAEARRQIARYDSEAFRTAKDVIVRYADALLMYPVKAGVLSEREAALMRKANPNYVPFVAVRPDLLDGAIGTGPSRMSGRMFRFQKGGAEAIRDPIEALAVETARVIRRTNELMVLRGVAALAEVPGMGRYIERLDREQMRHVHEARQDALEQNGQLSLFPPEVQDTAIPFYRSNLRESKGLVPIRNPRTGKTEWYRVEKPVWDAVSSMDGARLPWLIDLAFGKPKRALTLGVTGINLPFQLRNLVRDGAQSYLQSPTVDNPAAYARDWMRGFGEAALGAMGRDNPNYDLFVALAGKASTPLVHDSRRTMQAIRGLFGEGRGRRVVRVLEQPIESLRDVLQFSEAVPRLGEMRRTLEGMGWRPGDVLTPEQAIAARIAIKEASVDFTASGTFIRWANQVVPFLNAQIQGHRAMYRTFRDRPVAGLLKALSTQTAPALALWMANKDEDWYRDMPWQERYTYWWFDLGPESGEVIGVPRAFDWGGAFGTMAEAVADSIYRQDPEAVLQGLDFMRRTSALQYTDWETLATATPLTQFIYERTANKDVFRQSPLETMGDLKKPAREREGPYTTGLARTIGRALDWSPKKIDHFLDTFFGNLPRDVLDFADVFGLNVGSSGPAGTGFKSVPVVGQAFGRRGGREGFRSLATERLYEQIEEARLRQGSIENPETPQEKQRRLGLEDAADAIAALRIVQRHTSTLQEAQAVQREIRALTVRALREAGRLRFRGEVIRARGRASRAATTPEERRRILRPGR